MLKANRIARAVLAFSFTAGLLGATAANADPGYYHRGGYGYHDGYRDYGRDYGRRYHHDNTGAAIAVGVGLIALTAILASQHDRDYDRAPPRAYGPDYGPGYGYDQYRGPAPRDADYTYGPQQNGPRQPCDQDRYYQAPYGR